MSAFFMSNNRVIPVVFLNIIKEIELFFSLARQKI